MGAIELVFGIIILLLALGLSALVLLQSGKDGHLSGAIAGGMDTFFSKSKTTGTDRLLVTLTIVAAVLFGIMVVALYVIL
jgi:preprotein translocase subunit SecG